MSQENLELVRAMLETWNLPGDEWLAFFDPAVEFSDVQVVTGMRDRGSGIDDLRKAVDQWVEIFREWRIEVRDLVDLGGDHVLAELQYSGIGAESGVRVSGDQVDIYRLRDEKVVEYRAGYRSKKEALAAVGLRD